MNCPQIAKAFDSVDHRIFRLHLYRVGISGKLSTTLFSCLTSERVVQVIVVTHTER